jgi:carbonic anhydrase/acetyltransferase-like protein (isoleucine patch superfamily)
LYRYKQHHPEISPDVYIAPSADIIGNVLIGPNSSIWFNVTIRGDVHYIKIGAETNIQDNCMLHVTNGRYPLHIGNRVTVAHGAILHGCTIHDNTLVGMGATVLDNCVIGENSIVAAGALVREGKKYPAGVLIAGMPAEIKRDLNAKEIEKNTQYAKNYINYKNDYMAADTVQPIVSGG